MNAPYPPGASVACYLRDSGGARQELSVQQQLESVRLWCQERSLLLTRIFADAARPGSTLANRDQLDEMLRYFDTSPPEAGVVFWDYSRWARNYDDGQYLLSRLRRLGYVPHSLEEYIPPGSIGKVIEGMYLWGHEEYREQLSRNVRRGMHFIVSQHHAYPLPDVPAGYRRAPLEIGSHRDGSPRIVHQLIPDPARLPLVRQAFALRAGGSSIAEIHACTGLFKTRKSYRDMFTNRIYTGVFEYGGQVYADFCVPVIDPHTWRAVQAVTQHWKERAGVQHPRRSTSPYLLSGLARCAACGSPLVGKAHGKYSYYACTGRFSRLHSTCTAAYIPASELEEQVIEHVRTHALHPRVLAVALEEYQSEAGRRFSEYSAQYERTRADLADTQAGIARILSAIQEQGHSRALLGRLAELEAQRDELQLRLSDLRTEQPAPLPPLDIAAYIQEALAILADPDPRPRQLFLRSIVREIRVMKSTASVLEGSIALILPTSQALSLSFG